MLQDPNGEIYVSFGVSKVPETWIIDPNGYVRFRSIATVTADGLAAVLNQLKGTGAVSALKRLAGLARSWPSCWPRSCTIGATPGRRRRARTPSASTPSPRRSSARCAAARACSTRKADASQNIRDEIARQVAAGRTDDQIRAYINDRFKDQGLLLVPPKTGIDSLVWVLPVVALVLRRRRSRSSPSADGAPAPDHRARPTRTAPSWSGTAASHDARRTATAAGPTPTGSPSSRRSASFLLRSLDDLDREHDAGDIDDGRLRHPARRLHGRAPPPCCGPSSRSRRRCRRSRAATGAASRSVGGRRRRRGGRRRRAGGVGVGRPAARRLQLGQHRPERHVQAGRGPVAARPADLKGAIQRYDEVLKVEPDNAEALAYRGWLVALRRQRRRNATDLVQRASSRCSGPCRSRPTTPTPFCFEAIVRFRLFDRRRRRPCGAGRPVPRPQPAPEVLGLVAGPEARDRRRPRRGSTTTAP